MRSRAISALLLITLLAGTVEAASPYFAAAKQLDGKWQGESFMLKIDAYRAQANIDLNRPFHWQRFLVKDVADDKITFSIGAELYEATLQADALKLTSTSFRGERFLFRSQQSDEPTPPVNALGLRR